MFTPVSFDQDWNIICPNLECEQCFVFYPESKEDLPPDFCPYCCEPFDWELTEELI